MKFLNALFNTIKIRKKNLPKNSYTTSLFQAGKVQMWNKIREESDEVIKASKSEGRKRIIEEVADLWYHLLVLLAEENIELEDIEKELESRSKKLRRCD